MTYQKPINPQRFDEPIYEQLRPKKKTKQTRRLENKQKKQRTTQSRSASKESGAAKTGSRVRP